MSNAKSQTRIECGKQGDTCTIRFSSETGVNILSSRVLGELGTIVGRVAQDAHCRFVVLRGEGKTFFAGADIGEMSHFSEDQGLAYSKHGHSVFNALEQLPQATLALVNGHALGGGCELTLACDFRIAVAGARLGLPESRLGLIPGWGGTRRLPRLVGVAHARRLMFSGEQIAAAEALRIGLVDEVVEAPEQLDPALERWRKLLLPGAPAAITRIKQALLNREETCMFGQCFNCSDARAGMAAFLEKKPAPWTGAGEK